MRGSLQFGRGRLGRALATGAVIGWLTLSPAVLAAATPGAPGPARPQGAGYEKLGFNLLASFQFTPPTIDAVADPQAPLPGASDQIPAAIRKWHGRKVIVTGYMLPLKSVEGRVTELLLTRNTMASMNLTPFMMNEWIVVKIAPGVRAQTLQPVSFFGTFKVGAIYEHGYMVAIYELAADRMSEKPVF